MTIDITQARDLLRRAIDRLWVMDPRDAYFEVLAMEHAVRRATDHYRALYLVELRHRFGAENADLILSD